MQQQTYRFFGLFNTGFYRGTLGVIVNERVDLILTEDLDILFGVEFLWASVPASRARHEKFAGGNLMPKQRSAAEVQPPLPELHFRHHNKNAGRVRSANN